jgi:antitoxin CptB
VSEGPEARRKRLAMRSWRRGTKEMDLVLGPYADAHLAAMTEAGLRDYDLLLEESDQELILWVTGQRPAPEKFARLVADVAAFAGSRPKTG